ncbi:MAG: archaetidylserine decarboxylase [Bdellovibrionales bacterium]
MKALGDLFFSWVLPWIPKRLMSRAWGLMMRVPWPWPLRIPLNWLFAKAFSIDLSEAEKTPGQYSSFDDLFTRRLKPGLRPVEGDFVSPVDGALTEYGPVVDGQILQVKGWEYPLEEFLGSHALAKSYEGGSFATLYLCPADYHRVHTPLTGNLVSALHIPGQLWPVNEWSVKNIQRLFCLNERVVLNFLGSKGPFSVVMVGATNVGKMSIYPDPSIVTNRWMWHAPTVREYEPAIALKCGEELGAFHLGSTVVLVLGKGYPAVTRARGAIRLGHKLN